MYAAFDRRTDGVSPRTSIARPAGESKIVYVRLSPGVAPQQLPHMHATRMMMLPIETNLERQASLAIAARTPVRSRGARPPWPDMPHGPGGTRARPHSSSWPATCSSSRPSLRQSRTLCTIANTTSLRLNVGPAPAFRRSTKTNSIRCSQVASRPRRAAANPMTATSTSARTRLPAMVSATP